MKNKLKKIYQDSKPFLRGFFTTLGFIAIFDWVIAPGLTTSNTIINILSFILAGVISILVGIIMWNELKIENKGDEITEEPKKEENKDGISD